MQFVSVSLPVIADRGGLEAQARRHSVLVCFPFIGVGGMLTIVQGTEMWKWQYFCTVSKACWEIQKRKKCDQEFLHFNKYMIYLLIISIIIISNIQS